MGRAYRPKYVHTVEKDGRTYHYLRAPGKARVRLPDAPLDSPEFLVAYAEAIGRIAAKPTRGTAQELVQRLLSSPMVDSFSPAYRRMMATELHEIAAAAGDARASSLTPAAIRLDLSSLPPHRAIKRMKAWRLLCAYGVQQSVWPSDPSDGVNRPKAPQTSGHEPWTRRDVDAYRDRWPCGTHQRVAMELLFWTGARISDVVTLGWHLVGDDGVLEYRQAKTGSPAYVPWTCLLPPFARYADRDHLHAAIAPIGAKTWLETGGHQRSHHALSHMFPRWAEDAGVAKTAHGLRKSRATALADGGATAHQIAAWTGHLSLSEVQHYTRAAERRGAVMG